MGRSLSGAFGAGPSNTVSQGVFNLKAGVAVLQNDLLELSADGMAYPVKVTDNAAISNCTIGGNMNSSATGQIVAQTQVMNAQTLAYARQAVLQGSDGSIFAVTPYNNPSYGIRLTRYSSSGTLIGYINIDASTDSFNNFIAFFLSNGNICIVATKIASYETKFAICDPNLSPVKTLTALAEASVGSSQMSAVALSAGGFAVVYQYGAAPLQSRLVTYDNAGSVVLAPTTIWTRTGGTAPQFHRMAQLSNGNLVIGANSTNTVSSMGFFHGVVTPGGVSVLALTNLSNYVIGDAWPELATINGFYAIAYSTGAGSGAVSVFDNTGSLQGAPLATVGNLGVGNKSKMVAGNGNFWFVAKFGTNSNEGVAKIPTSGTGYATYNISADADLYGGYIDAFYENGLIVIVCQPGVGANSFPRLFVFSESTLTAVNTGTSLAVQPGTSTGTYQRIIPAGDFSFILMYDYNSTAATNIFVGKYANTAIIGVAQGAAAAGSLVPTATPSGGYACNQLKGSLTKTFDHSAANIYGNKGAMLTYGVTLKGM